MSRARPPGWVEEVREAIFGNAAYKLIALAIAVFVWVLVQNEQVESAPARARIEWVFPDGLVPVEPPLEHVVIGVEGAQAFVRTLPQRTLVLPVDLSRAREGETTVTLADRRVRGLADQVRVTSVSPTSLKLTLDRVLRRRVPVTAVTRGEVAPGYRLARLSVEPNRVDISGPSSVVRALTEVSTDAVAVNSLSEDAEFPVALALRRGQVSVADDTKFVVKVDVEPIIEERSYEATLEMTDRRWSPGEATVAVSLEGPLVELDRVDPAAVRARVVVPEGWQSARGTARYDAADGPRIEVDHGGGAGVRVTRVRPSAVGIELQPQGATP